MRPLAPEGCKLAVTVPLVLLQSSLAGFCGTRLRA